jgi:ADP-ribosylglycohydrolase
MTNSPLRPDHDERLNRVRLAIDGLSVGDAFGQQFFLPGFYFRYYRKREVPPGPWRYTDDTEMALAIAEVLSQRGHVDQERLAGAFARRYERNPKRGYGGGAAQLLSALASGQHWQNASRSLFGGQGSFGNGGAMRAAPIGAYFVDDLNEMARQARLSAEVTHAHPEGQAGAMAIAAAAAGACHVAQDPLRFATTYLLDLALANTPEGETRYGIERALAFPLDTDPVTVAARIGNGSRVSAMDTVPFALWCAARHINDFAEALWCAVSVGGDIDTNCAIVGGIVALGVGRERIPPDWLWYREKLPDYLSDALQPDPKYP